MKFALVLALVGAVALVGCAVSMENPCLYVMQPEDFEDSQTFSASFDKIWEALVDSISDMEFPIESIEKDSGLITTGFVNLGEFHIETPQSNAWKRDWTTHPYVTCDSKDCLDIPGTVRGKLSCVVTENDAGVRIRVNTHFEGQKKRTNFATMASTYDWVNCNSTGEVEAMIFAKVQVYLDEL